MSKTFLVVTGTIGFLVLGAVAFSMSTSIRDSEEDIYPDLEDRTAARLRVLAQELQFFSESHEAYPVSLDSLAGVDLDRSSDDLTLTQDAWGRPIHYTVSDSSYVLFSAGEDGVVGSEDDIVHSGPSQSADLVH